MTLGVAHRRARSHIFTRLAAAAAIGVFTLGLAASPIATVGSDQRLVEAAKAQDWALVQSLLREKADVHSTQPDGATALHWAVYWDRMDAVDALLEAGAPVNSANEFGATPLWLACSEGRSAMVERLLRAGANANAALLNGETPLMTASRTGSLEAVKLLIAHGARVNDKESGRQQTALMWAVSERHSDVTGVLVEAGADVSARSSVRRMLVNTGQDGLRRLSGDYTDFLDEDQGGFTPLLIAARVGDTESAKLLVRAGADINEPTPMEASPLVIAAHSGQSETAHALLDLGADPNAAGAGYTALHLAILRSDLALAKHLLAKGANPNAPIEKSTPTRRNSQDWALHPSWIGATPLWLAAKFADATFMHALSDAGANARFVRQDGSTVLLATMADGPDRRTPTFLPPADRREVERRTLEAITLAVDLGLDVNAATGAGDTVLHGAAARGYNSIIEWLVAHGATVDVKNKKGLTPLALASAASQRALQAAQLGVGGAVPSTGSTVDLLKKLGATQ